MVPDLGPTDGLVSGFLGSDGPDAVLEKVSCEGSVLRACVRVCHVCQLPAWSNKLQYDAGILIPRIEVSRGVYVDLDQNNQPHS